MNTFLEEKRELLRRLNEKEPELLKARENARKLQEIKKLAELYKGYEFAPYGAMLEIYNITNQ